MCDSYFEVFYDLNFHLSVAHESDPLFPCEDCELIFTSFPHLEQHIITDHGSPLPSPGIPDQRWDSVYNTTSELHEHQKDCHEMIPQVDGLANELVDFDFTSLPSNTTVRSASFTLNQEKQTAKIVKDAARNDFEANINNNDTNVTVKCSAGFYIQVARPSFSSIRNGSVFSSSNVAISVTDVVTTKDRSGVEGTMLMQFEFMNETSKLGTAAVHLHHSTRTLQIQGSQIMPDSSKAAVWFYNTFISTRFKELAKAKKFDISNVNSSILKLSRKPIHDSQHDPAPINSCQECKAPFISKAKPSRCNQCGKYFHKRTCLKDHTKTCQNLQLPSPRPSVFTSPETQSSSLIPPTFTPTTSSSTSNPTKALTSTSQSIPHQSPSLPSILGLQASVTFVPATPFVPSSTTSATPSSNSSTNTAQYQPTSNDVPGPSQTALAGAEPPPAKPIKKTKKSSIPVTPSGITMEFLKTELGAAQARIVQLDAEIKDKDQRTSVLWSRIKILEEKQNTDILNKYFPQSNPNNQTPSVQTPIGSSTSTDSQPQPSSCASSSLSTCFYAGNCARSQPSSFHCCCLHHTLQTQACAHLPHQHSCPSNPTASTSPPPDGSQDILVKVNNLINDVHEMRVAIATLASLQPEQDPPPMPTYSRDSQAVPSNSNPKADSGSNPEVDSKSIPEDDHQADPQVDPAPSLNASVASVEELIPESMNISAESLNCEDPTSHPS